MPLEENGNRYFNCKKLKVKVIPATQEEITSTNAQGEVQEEDLSLTPDSARIVAWVSPLVLV